VPDGGGCILVEERGGDPGSLIRRVEGIVQDPAAALVTRFAGFSVGSRIGDLCAAPGGKALALAAKGVWVVAADRSLPRLRLVGKGAQRLGLGPGRVVALAEQPPFRTLDGVLLDVPCSGTGTLARHPDARWRLTPGDVAALSRVQERILEGASPVVRPGGLLVYSTCTMEVEENEERVEAFLARHPEFELEKGEAARGIPAAEEGLLQLLPQNTGFDGAFAARLRRTA